MIESCIIVIIWFKGSDVAVDVKQIGERVSRESALLTRVRAELGRVIVGQEALIDRLLLALLCNNHVLIEGVPGLAKTLTVTTLAKCLDATFHRIQFTPDLLPADVVGTLVYNPKTGDFTTKKGPIFAHVILADEINRAPAKVQSALLEAMQERQVTVGSWCWQRRIPSSRRAPTPCRKPRSTASCSSSRSNIPARWMN